jgi:hypothetical protein
MDQIAAGRMIRRQDTIPIFDNVSRSIRRVITGEKVSRWTSLGFPEAIVQVEILLGSSRTYRERSLVIAVRNVRRNGTLRGVKALPRSCEHSHVNEPTKIKSTQSSCRVACLILITLIDKFTWVLASTRNKVLIWRTVPAIVPLARRTYT